MELATSARFKMSQDGSQETSMKRLRNYGMDDNRSAKIARNGETNPAELPGERLQNVDAKVGH
jgi:hypothetical protein